MLETERVGVIRHQLIVFHIVAEVYPGYFCGGQSGAVAAIFQFVVVDVGHVSRLFIIIDGIVKGRGILNIYEIIFVRAVVDGQIVAAVILIVIQVIRSIIVIVCGIVVIPGLEIRAIGIVVVIGGVLVQEVRQLDVGLIVVCIIGGVMDSIKSFIIAINNPRVCFKT